MIDASRFGKQIEKLRSKYRKLDKEVLIDDLIFTRRLNEHQTFIIRFLKKKLSELK